MTRGKVQRKQGGDGFTDIDESKRVQIIELANNLLKLKNTYDEKTDAAIKVFIQTPTLQTYTDMLTAFKENKEKNLKKFLGDSDGHMHLKQLFKELDLDYETGLKRATNNLTLIASETTEKRNENQSTAEKENENFNNLKPITEGGKSKKSKGKRGQKGGWAEINLANDIQYVANTTDLNITPKPEVQAGASMQNSLASTAAPFSSGANTYSALRDLPPILAGTLDLPLTTGGGKSKKGTKKPASKKK